MTSLTYPQKTVGAHTVHSVPNLDYWRNLVLDYLDDSDDINLYFAAQKLNVLAPEDPVGLYGLACAQRYRGELNTAYFNVIQARRRLAYNSGFPVTYEEALELEAICKKIETKFQISLKKKIIFYSSEIHKKYFC